MSAFALVVPLKPDAYERAQELLAEGPPFQLADTPVERHEVYLTRREAVFVFVGPNARRELGRMAENPALWRAAAAWQGLMAERPRVADAAFSWAR